MFRWPALLLSTLGLGAAPAIAMAQDAAPVINAAQDAPPAGAAPTAAPAAAPDEFHQAVELIHAYGGSGDALEQAGQLALGLKKSHPEGGYAEALQAEAMSSQAVQQDGTPESAAVMAIDLADKAIALNPALALPHIAKARVLVRSSKYDDAARELDAARKLDPDNESILFLEADRLRRTGDVAGAEAQFRAFIAATPSPQRKSNGYYWLAKDFVGAAERGADGRPELLDKAGAAFVEMLKLDPGSLAKTVNYAVFLNDVAGDYVAAERVARQAVAIKDVPIARHNVAIARYQQLLAGAADGTLDKAALQAKVDAIGKDGGVTLDQAIALPDISTAIQLRLLSLKARL
jgi:tetratricopeptide (TPR) repeat protein